MCVYKRFTPTTFTVITINMVTIGLNWTLYICFLHELKILTGGCSKNT